MMGSDIIINLKQRKFVDIMFGKTTEEINIHDVISCILLGLYTTGQVGMWRDNLFF